MGDNVVRHEAAQFEIPDTLGAQIRLANLALSKIPGNERVPADLRNDIEEGLDKLWPFGDAACAFSGLCQIVESHPGEDRLAEDFVDEAVATGMGLYVARFGNERKHWTVAFGFSAGNIGDVGEDYVSCKYFLHTQANYGIVPLDELEKSFPEGLYFPDLYEGLTRHSDGLAKNMQDGNFYDLTADEQKYFIDISIDAAESEAETAEGGLKNRRIGVQGEYGYVLSSDGQESYYEPLDTSMGGVKGVCEGLMVLARWQVAQGEKITGPEELVHVGSGLCLKIRVDGLTAQALELQEDQEIYIPISGQDIEVYFDAEAIKLM